MNNKFQVIRPIAVTDSGAFTRASAATYYDIAGVLQSAGNNVPRFGFDPVSHDPLGLITEAAATNYTSSSEAIAGSWGSTGGLGATADTTVAPDGTTTMDRLVPANATAQQSKINSVTVPAASSVTTFSCFCKAAGSSYIQLAIDCGPANNGVYANFNVATGALVAAAAAYGSGAGSVTSVNGGVEEIGGGIYRCWVAGASNGTALRTATICPLNAANSGAGAKPTIALTNADTVDVWGGMLEVTSASNQEPTSYIKTTGSQATRAADTNTAKMLSNIPEPATGADPDPAAWNAATAYVAGDRVHRTTTHKIYQRLVNGTTPGAPESDPTNWVLVGPTNRWRMFDAANESQSSLASVICVAFKLGEVCDSIAFENVDADSIRVFVDGSSYDETLDLKTRFVDDWWEYFFEPFRYRSAAVFSGLPLLTTSVIQVIVTKTGGTPKVGTCVPGLSKTLGSAIHGAGSGIRDYSVRETDDFGNTTVVPRAYAKRINADVIIENEEVDDIHALLATYRSTPVFWIGAGNLYASLIVYGYYRSFDIVVEYPTQSRVALEIEGLT